MGEEPQDPLIDRVVADRYRLLRCVGRGGMGAVYEGRHVQTEKRVAVKILAPHLSKDLKLIARFRREAMAASRLDHENCVRVYDFGEDKDGTFYIAMEFVEGRGLGQEIRHSGPMPQARVARIGVQLLSALDAAHASGILHRDLKPQNIMLTRVGKHDIIKVVDFGIAKFISNTKEDQAALTVPGTIFGTPEYMSPEQARGEELDSRSDLYSAAVVLWHLLLGRSPFRGKTVRETLVKVFGEKPPSARGERPGAGIDKRFEDVLLKALEKSRKKRYSDAVSFLHAIRRFDEGYALIDPTPHRAPVPGIAPDGSVPETLAGERSDPHLAALRRPTRLGAVDAPAETASDTSESSAVPDSEAGPSSSIEGLAAPPVDPAQGETTEPQARPVRQIASDAPTQDVPEKPTTPPAPAPPSAGPGFAEETTGTKSRPVIPPGEDDDDDLIVPGGAGRTLALVLGGAFALLLVGFGGWGVARLMAGTSSAADAGSGGPDLTAPPPPGYVADRARHDRALKLAQSAKSEGHNDLAREMYEQAVAADLDSGAAHQGLITVYLELGLLDEAEAHVDRLLEIDTAKYAGQAAFTKRLIEAARGHHGGDGGAG